VYRPLRVELADQQLGDHEAGDDEEHVDADVAAGREAELRVRQHDDRDGHGPEALDIRPEGHVSASISASQRGPTVSIP
jgi:hypothetical protein